MKTPYSLRRLFVTIFVMVIGIIASGCNSTTANATTENSDFKERVAYSGISFQGGDNEVSLLYPYTSALVGENKLSRVLYKAIQQQSPKNFDITHRILDRSLGEQYAITLMIDGEYIVLEDIEISGMKRFKLTVSLSAQGLIYDVKNAQFVRSIPLLPIQFIEVFESKPEVASISKIVEKLLTSKVKGEEGLLTLFVDAIEHDSGPRAARFSQIAVRKVVIEDKAKAILIAPFNETKLGRLKRLIAQQLTRQISTLHEAATQPYVVDSAVLRMQNRFDGGLSTIDLSLPEPAYEIEFKLRGFKRIEHDKTKAATAFLYASFSHLKVNSNIGKKRTIFDQALKNGASKVVLAEQSIVDDFSAFRESMLSMLSNSVSEIFNSKSAFFKAQKFNKNALKQVKLFQEAIESCK